MRDKRSEKIFFPSLGRRMNAENGDPAFSCLQMLAQPTLAVDPVFENRPVLE
jgi:hypothetical protein